MAEALPNITTQPAPNIVEFSNPAIVEKQGKWTPYPKENEAEVIRLTQELVAGLERFAGDYRQGIGAINAHLSGEFATHSARNYLKESGKLQELVSLFTPQEVDGLVKDFPADCVTGCKSNDDKVDFVSRVEKKELTANSLASNYLTNAINESSMSATQKQKATTLVSVQINAGSNVGAVLS